MDRIKTFDKTNNMVVWVVLCICLLAGVAVHLSSFIVCPSFFVDEATIASTVCTRHLWNLVLSPMDMGQSAPVLYLYAVKVASLIFGQGERSLRLVSLLSWFGTITVLFVLIKDKCGKLYAACITAIFGLLPWFIRWGNQLKPYMTDNFCCLSVLLIYSLYAKDRIKLSVLAALYSVIVWMSFAAVFFVASCSALVCIPLLLHWIRTKEKKDAKQLLLLLTVALSFAINYVLWLSRSVDNAGGKAYWDLLRFPLLPKSFSDIKLWYTMLKHLVNPIRMKYQLSSPIAAIMFVLFCVDAVRSKDAHSIFYPCGIATFLMLIASSMGLYPMEDRLIQPYSIILFLCIALGLYVFKEEILKEFVDFPILHSSLRLAFYGALFLLLLFNASDARRFISGDYIRWSNYGEESRHIMKTLMSIKSDNDIVYVYGGAAPVYRYLTSYKTDEKKTIFGNGVKKGVRMLTPYDYYAMGPDEDAVNKEAALIAAHDSVYLFITHCDMEMDGMAAVCDALSKYGKVELVEKYYAAWLYHFEKGAGL